MNCFVIMPFSPEFDDVYASIKGGVEDALAQGPNRCSRLDEMRPAGRITERLLAQLQSASFCVADLTGSKPNVMWEVGYAMALSKPTIVVTQNLKELPFDLKDMQSLEYSRSHLSTTLRSPLRRIVIDTVEHGGTRGVATTRNNDASDEVIAELRGQVAELKSIVSQAVEVWSPRAATVAREVTDSTTALAALQGSWINMESGSHMYASIVEGDLVAPYCYGGNEELVGVYFGWKKAGDYWFARFAWLDRRFTGFAFLKHEALDRLTGAWWSDDGGVRVPSSPPDAAGVPWRLKRLVDVKFPKWAEEFLADVKSEGLASRLARG